MFPFKTALTILTFGALLLLPDYVPALRAYKSLDWHTVPVVWDFQPREKSTQPVEDEQVRLKPNTDERKTDVYPVIDDGSSMDHFYRALWRADRQDSDAQVRILHYGDSPTTADLITADARELLQHRFGNGGHGFVLLAKPWAWYGHRGVEISASGWNVDAASMAGSGRRDGRFGIGGVSFTGSEGAHSRLTLSDDSHTSLEVAYLTQPDGGTFTVSADGQEIGEGDTSAGEPGPGYLPLKLPPHTKHIEVRVKHGTVRMFGIEFLRGESGVVYNSLGLNGAYSSVLAKFFDANHWGEQLKHYQPDLVIVNYGTNESMYANYVNYAYRKEMREVIRRIRTAVPDASILVMSPMDRGERDATGEITTVPTLLRLVSMQQQIADEDGCGYFNTFQAMGGPGTMGKWYAAEPRLVGADFIHPMPSGAKLVGNLLYRALLDGFNKYKLKHMQEEFAKQGEIAQ